MKKARRDTQKASTAAASDMGGVSDVLRIITPVVAMVGMGLVIMKFSNLQT